VPHQLVKDRGMDIAYDGTWGYHPLIVSLANTGEVLGLVNRPGNRPSHEGAAAEVDRAMAVCFQGGFRKVLLRGDTDFSQTEHLDRWDEDPRVRFIFGYDAAPNLEEMARALPARAWRPLERPARYEVKTQPRRRRDKVKEAIVVQRGFENLRLRCEEVAEFNYRPTACKKTYRMIVVRKNVTRAKGEVRPFCPRCRWRRWLCLGAATRRESRHQQVEPRAKLVMYDRLSYRDTCYVVKITDVW